MISASLLFVLLQSGAAATQDTPRPAVAVFRSVVPVIYARDIRRSATFYRDVLAFELKSFIVGSAQTVKELSPTDDPYGADFSIGKQSISLQRFRGVRSSGTRLDIVVDDLTAYHQRLAGLRVKMHRFTRSTDGRVFCFSVHDPDRHEILFLQRQEEKIP